MILTKYLDMEINLDSSEKAEVKWENSLRGRSWCICISLKLNIIPLRNLIFNISWNSLLPLRIICPFKSAEK